MEDPNLEAQARRELEFGEQRFLAGDINGATRCAQNALNAAPALAGAEQALVAYAVHTAAAATLGSGAPDWYAVLGLPRPQREHQQLSGGGGGGITHDAIKRQHRSLCLLVYPDKNTSVAANGAFKLVQAAYDALSAVHPPQPAAADRLTWEEKVDRFWKTAGDDITPPPPAPKQPPIARPKPRRAATQEMPPLLPAPSCQAQVSGPPAPGQPQRPSCPLSPYCIFCRSYTDGAQEGFSVLESRTVPHGRQNGLLGFGDHGYCFN